MPELREERMSDGMVKYHLDGLPRAVVLHHFTQPDHGPAHDHPFAFVSYIVSGSYVEEVFDRKTGKSCFVRHYRGDSFLVRAKHIHRIVDLPEGECWTLITPMEWEQTSGFWEFRADGAYYRPWNRAEFERVESTAGDQVLRTHQ